MKVFEKLTDCPGQPLLSSQSVAALASQEKQSALVREKLSALAEALSNQSQLLDAKFGQVLAGLNNQSNLLNEKLSALAEESSTQSELLNTKFDQILAGLNNQSSLLNEKFDETLATQREQLEIMRSSKKEVSLEEALETVRQNAGTETNAALIFDQVLRDLVAPYHRTMSWGDRLLTLDKLETSKPIRSFKRRCRYQTEPPDRISTTLRTAWHGACRQRSASWRTRDNSPIWIDRAGSRSSARRGRVHRSSIFSFSRATSRLRALCFRRLSKNSRRMRVHG